jgi:hypothetical protein
MNTSGTVLIDGQFDVAERFTEGLAVVEVKGSCGYTDTEGRYVVKSSLGSTIGFSEGLAGTERDGK